MWGPLVETLRVGVVPKGAWVPVHLCRWGNQQLMMRVGKKAPRLHQRYVSELTITMALAEAESLWAGSAEAEGVVFG